MTQKNESSRRIVTIPNALSLFRLLLIPLLIWLYCGEQNDRMTALVLLISGISDACDGFIARRFHMVSDLGKILDPVADKLTQLAMLFCLLTRFPILLVPFVLLLVKELTTGIMGLIVIRRTRTVLSADWHGKLTTLLLYSTMLLHLLWGKIPAGLSNGLAMLCTGVMLLSFVLYFIRNVRMLRTGNPHKAPKTAA